jgi:hypothetical protein
LNIDVVGANFVGFYKCATPLLPDAAVTQVDKVVNLEVLSVVEGTRRAQ